MYSALLYNANLKGFREGTIYTGPLKKACIPGLNCYSCPGAVAACPLGTLQNALASSDKKAPWYILGILFLFGLTLGRTVCGFLCPVGLLQELLHRIPVPKIRKSRITRVLSHAKYAILLIFVVTIPLYYACRHLPVPAFCKVICPAGTLEGAIALMAHPANQSELSLLGFLFTRKFIILVLILLMCVFLYRFFCRFLCPLGAIYGLFNRFCFAGVHVDETECISCGRCTQICEMDVRCPGDRECIQCGQCIDVCPVHAIHRGYLHPRTAVKQSKAVRRTVDLICGILAAALLGAVLWLGNSEPSESPAQTNAAEAEDVFYGSEPGMLCPDFSAPYYQPKEGSFTLSEARGRVVVINFWATWCGPCCEEMPVFDQLQKAYPGIVVIAIHSALITDDVQKYLDQQNRDLSFAQDETGSIIASLGGSLMLPQTVIVDPYGRIVYNAVGSVSYENLESIVQHAIRP